MLCGIDDRPVVYSTQLDGPHGFDFEYSRPVLTSRQIFPVQPFSTENQLGLKLEVSKQTVPVMIIDHAKEPVEKRMAEVSLRLATYLCGKAQHTPEIREVQSALRANGHPLFQRSDSLAAEAGSKQLWKSRA